MPDMIKLDGNAGWQGQLLPVRAQLKEALSDNYVLTVDVLSDSASLDPSAALNRRESVTLSVGDASRKIQGVVRAARYMGSLPQGMFWYQLELVPRVALMAFTLRSRVFCTEQTKKIGEVITEVLSSAQGVQLAATDYKTNLQSSAYPQRDMVVQYHESDFAFFSRLAEDAGIFYFFQQGENGETICFGDSNMAFPLLSNGSAGTTLAFRTDVGASNAAPALRSVQLSADVVSAGSQLTERFYASPSTVLQLQSAQQSGGVGLQSWAEQDGYVDAAWGQALADIRAQEAGVVKRQLHAESDCLGLSAGCAFDLSGHDSSQVNARYLVTDIVHEVWDSARGIDYLPGMRPHGQGYLNRLSAIPMSVPFRPARKTARPRINGFVRATIDGADAARSNVDDLGCYRIIFSFDTVQRGPGLSSAPVRLLTPFGGPDEGFHFPLRPKTQVMLSFLNGDPDRPVIAGPLYDAGQKSVVSHTNRVVNQIRTVSGITIKMSDGLPSSD